MQEYFERTRKDWFPDAESDIAKICITYLSFSVFESGFCQTDDEFEVRLGSHRLYDYAAHNWGYHARVASTSSQEMMDFLQCEAKVEASAQALMAVGRYSGYSQRVPRQMTRWHLAAYFGVREAVKAFLDEDFPDVKDSYGLTPLSWAAEKGHKEVVKLLLPMDGIDVNSKDKDRRTALSFAAEKGHQEVVKLLLATDGIDVNSKSTGWYDGPTALSFAAKEGHKEVVKLLLATDGIDVNSKDEDGRTALLFAAEKGHQGVVKLLLATDGIDVNSKSTGDYEDGRTALLFVAEKGNKEVVKLLLAMDGIDINSKSPGDYKDGRTALLFVAEKGHEAAVKLLLLMDDIDVNSNNSSSLMLLL